MHSVQMQQHLHHLRRQLEWLLLSSSSCVLGYDVVQHPATVVCHHPDEAETAYTSLKWFRCISDNASSSCSFDNSSGSSSELTSQHIAPEHDWYRAPLPPLQPKLAAARDRDVISIVLNAVEAHTVALRALDALHLADSASVAPRWLSEHTAREVVAGCDAWFALVQCVAMSSTRNLWHSIVKDVFSGNRTFAYWEDIVYSAPPQVSVASSAIHLLILCLALTVASSVAAFASATKSCADAVAGAKARGAPRVYALVLAAGTCAILLCLSASALGGIVFSLQFSHRRLREKPFQATIQRAGALLTRLRLLGPNARGAGSASVTGLLATASELAALAADAPASARSGAESGAAAAAALPVSLTSLGLTDTRAEDYADTVLSLRAVADISSLDALRRGVAPRTLHRWHGFHGLPSASRAHTPPVPAAAAAVGSGAGAGDNEEDTCDVAAAVCGCTACERSLAPAAGVPPLRLLELLTPAGALVRLTRPAASQRFDVEREVIARIERGRRVRASLPWLVCGALSAEQRADALAAGGAATAVVAAERVADLAQLPYTFPFVHWIGGASSAPGTCVAAAPPLPLSSARACESACTHTHEPASAQACAAEWEHTTCGICLERLRWVATPAQAGPAAPGAPAAAAAALTAAGSALWDRLSVGASRMSVIQAAAGLHGRPVPVLPVRTGAAVAACAAVAAALTASYAYREAAAAASLAYAGVRACEILWRTLNARATLGLGAPGRLRAPSDGQAHPTPTTQPPAEVITADASAVASDAVKPAANDGKAVDNAQQLALVLLDEPSSKVDGGAQPEPALPYPESPCQRRRLRSACCDARSLLCMSPAASVATAPAPAPFPPCAAHAASTRSSALLLTPKTTPVVPAQPFTPLSRAATDPGWTGDLSCLHRSVSSAFPSPYAAPAPTMDPDAVQRSPATRFLFPVSAAVAGRYGFAAYACAPPSGSGDGDGDGEWWRGSDAGAGWRGDLLALPPQCEDVGHVFHMCCLTQWAPRKLQCPLDRRPGDAEPVLPDLARVVGWARALDACEQAQI